MPFAVLSIRHCNFPCIHFAAACTRHHLYPSLLTTASFFQGSVEQQLIYLITCRILTLPPLHSHHLIPDLYYSVEAGIHHSIAHNQVPSQHRPPLPPPPIIHAMLILQVATAAACPIDTRPEPIHPCESRNIGARGTSAQSTCTFCRKLKINWLRSGTMEQHMTLS